MSSSDKDEKKPNDVSQTTVDVPIIWADLCTTTQPHDSKE